MSQRTPATPLHRERSNEVVYADFLCMGAAEESIFKYELTVKDDVSSYTLLCSCVSADSDVASAPLSKWTPCFGKSNWLLTVKGSHFETYIVESSAPEMHTQHHFTTAYYL